jgi:hypothetical protein
MSQTSLAKLQLAALLLTAIIYAVGYAASVRAMLTQSKHLRAQMRASNHAGLFARLFDLYKLQIERPELGEALNADFGALAPEQQTFFLALTDLLYLMYVEWTDLDAGLRQTWRAWAFRLSSSHNFPDLVAESGQYPQDFINQLTQPPRPLPTASSFR